VLQSLLQQENAPNRKLQIRIHLCELLFEQRPGAHLAPFAHGVATEIERHDLVRWDPPLALAGLKAAYRILANDGADVPAADRLLARITELDCMQALALIS